MSAPGLPVPEGAWDGHCHVFGPAEAFPLRRVKAGIDAKPDNDPGLVSLAQSSIEEFLNRAAAGRIWAREAWVREVP